MNRFPWYCIIKNVDVLDTPFENGIPMDEIWDQLGSDAYLASFGRNEPISSVAKKHYRKPTYAYLEMQKSILTSAWMSWKSNME